MSVCVCFQTDLNEKTSKVSVLKRAFEEVSFISAERKEGVESREHAAERKHSPQTRKGKIYALINILISITLRWLLTYQKINKAL